MQRPLVKRTLAATLLLFSLSALANDYVPYGGSVTFKGKQGHRHQEFRDKTFWASCAESTDVCQEFVIVVKDSGGRVTVGKTIDRADVERHLKNIVEDVTYTYGARNEIFSLTSKSVYAETPALIYYPVIAGAFAADVIKSPVSATVGAVKESRLRSKMQKIYRHMFSQKSKGKNERVSVANPGEAAGFEISQAFKRELI